MRSALRDRPRENDHEPTRYSQLTRRAFGRSVALIFSLVLFVGPAVAQSGGAGSAFCGTEMAQTIKNIFDIIQFGGPLIGGVITLGATVAIPATRRSDWKKEMKTMRNQALLWGVIVAPLGTEIVQFILNNIVAGGTSCGF